MTNGVANMQKAIRSASTAKATRKSAPRKALQTKAFLAPNPADVQKVVKKVLQSPKRTASTRTRKARSATSVVSKQHAAILAKYKNISGVQRHQVIQTGLITSDLMHFVDSYVNISAGDVYKSLGVSPKTIERNATARLSPAHSNAALALIEVTELAERVLGGQAAAEEWMLQPAMGLDRQIPLHLLTSTPGIESVKELLQRIDYGVYA
jgi:putative toxin-antitoxin system antitoxin component (TIGR02293 family)